MINVVFELLAFFSSFFRCAFPTQQRLGSVRRPYKEYILTVRIGWIRALALGHDERNDEQRRHRV